MSQLSYARYGKDNVRLYKVDKDPKTGIHTIVEQTVRILLEGDIETSYTKADNSVVVATDTQKQTTYILAKQHPIDPPEQFAAIIGNHFISTYPHIHAAHVKIIQHRWTRMNIDGKPHPHSFYRDGEEIRVIESVTREGEGVSIRSKIEKLLVLKSTGSAFHGFHRDEYTKLPETWDRILSTEIEAGWQWKLFKSMSEVKAVDFNGAWKAARDITMKIFAEDDSASVQATMFKMGDKILATVPLVEAVDYALPNKHYFEIDLSWHKGIENLGKDATVLAPQSDPNGLIQCTITRQGTKSKL
ncbi:uricase [Cucurbitaria berberidis CBS 394.84]|uniref:Uricase n=1 Tax=Cucurbitaria berberidis CBS 394.84 TaxID=1168544 RepID=A0A9P4GBA9_9PLEO|nr:uricase [Cucurbitaria berberidis CBS 394.84]KAF1842447.1 uricase [Cucurbitaria berberidis CBS 394.84]